MRFKFLPAVLAITALLPLHMTAYADDRPGVSAQACVVMAQDGQCVFEKNADARSLIASTTKLMTALICVESASMDEIVTVKPAHCQVEGSSMYLNETDSYSVKDLLLGLMLASGNDAALALADHVAGSEAAFVGMMNQRAEELGLSGTHFDNPHGLDAEGHYSTARDLAKLMIFCMTDPIFQELTGTYTAEINGQFYTNHNKLLRICPGCIGGKTGFTSAAGRCLVSCCQRDGLTFVCVTLSDPDDWKDHQALYNWAYETYMLRDLTQEARFDIPVISGSRRNIYAAPEESVQLVIPKNTQIELRAELPQFVFSPIKKGETAGKVWVIIEQVTVTELPLLYTDSVQMAYPVLQGLTTKENQT